MLNRSASLAMSTSVLKALPGKLDIKRHSPCIFYISANLAMSTSVLKALPGKLDIKRHSPCIFYISANLAMSTSVLKALPGKLDIKRHSPCIFYISANLAMSTCVLKALPGKLDIKRHSPSILYLSDFFCKLCHVSCATSAEHRIGLIWKVQFLKEFNFNIHSSVMNIKVNKNSDKFWKNEYNVSLGLGDMTVLKSLKFHIRPFSLFSFS